MAIPAPNINLLHERRESYTRQVASVSKAKVSAGMILAVYVVLLVVIVAFSLILKGQADNLTTDINQAKLAYSSAAAKELQLFNLSTKTKIIQNIINKRILMTKIWTDIRSKLPVGSRLVGFSMADKQVSVVIEAPHFVKSSQVLDMLEQNSFGFTILNSQVSLNRNNTGRYRISVEMKLGELNAQEE